MILRSHLFSMIIYSLLVSLVFSVSFFNHGHWSSSLWLVYVSLRPLAPPFTPVPLFINYHISFPFFCFLYP